jgi:hypothetical protein
MHFFLFILIIPFSPYAHNLSPHTLTTYFILPLPHRCRHTYVSRFENRTDAKAIKYFMTGGTIKLSFPGEGRGSVASDAGGGKGKSKGGKSRRVD